jgi:COP9 signalosome complex subunit 3
LAAREHDILTVYQPHEAIVPVRNALLRLDPTAGTFTSLHLQFVRLCLEAGVFEEALPIIEKPIHSIPQNGTPQFDGPYLCSAHQDSSAFITPNSNLTEKISEKDVQEYYLLVGMIYIGLRRWEDALLALELVMISSTQSTASGIMVEAYRKWILVGCLARGTVSRAGIDINFNVFR